MVVYDCFEEAKCFPDVSSGVSVPLHVNTSDEFSYNLIEMAKCRILVVDSIKQRKHVLEWRTKLPQLKTIIQYGTDSFDKADDLHTVRFRLLNLNII